LTFQRNPFARPEPNPIVSTQQDVFSTNIQPSYMSMSEPVFDSGYSTNDVFRVYQKPFDAVEQEPQPAFSGAFGGFSGMQIPEYNPEPVIPLPQIQPQEEQAPQPQEEFPPMPECEVLIVSESTTEETSATAEEEFPAIPEGVVVVDAIEETSLVEVVSSDSQPEQQPSAVPTTQEEGESAPRTPEKTPKKAALSPRERMRRKEEKMKKSKELNAIRYLQQMNPGSIPVSETMKATNIDVEDVDEMSEINAHVGIDEAAVSALYHGRIETQPRSPSRRTHDTPTKQRTNTRNATPRMQRTEEPVRFVASESGAELVRTDSRPTPVDFPPLGTEDSASPATQVVQEQVTATPTRTPKKQAATPVKAPRQPGTPLKATRQSPNRPARRPPSPAKRTMTSDDVMTEVPKILQNPRSAQLSVSDDDMMAFFMQ